MGRIETGVDRLVELINEKKRIPIDQAAKELGVSKVVIQEWADFLDEEKIISIEYKFSNTFLVERQLSQKEVKQKKKEYSSEKDAFVRKVESSLQTLENDSAGLAAIKKEFGALKKEIGTEIETVKDEVAKLENYEHLKKNLDKEIKKQVDEFHIILDKAHKEVDFEQKRHAELLQSLDIEKRELLVKEKRLDTLADKEKQVMARLQEIFDLSKNLEQNIGKEQDDISDSKKRIDGLQKSIKDIESNIIDKKKQIEPLLEKAKKHEEHILKLQDDILTKAKNKTEQIKSQVEEGSKVVDKFESFFERKSQIEKLIADIEAEKAELEEHYEKLRQKAIAFDLTTKSQTISKHMKEMEADLQTVNKEKGKLQRDLEKLIKFVKG